MRPAAAAAVIGLLAASAGWRLLLPAPGLALPPRARENPAGGFAYAVPKGWQIEEGERPRGGIISAVRLSDGVTTVEVLIGPGALYDRSRSAAGAARLVAEEFNGGEVHAETIERIEVDRLPALRIMAAGGRTYLPSPNAGRAASPLGRPAPRYESLEFAGVLVAVPGDGRSYLIKIVSHRDELARRRPFIEGFLGSFRVLKRPARPLF